jgi:hypothetical protein
MSGLVLHCSLCGRKQADGLLSRNAWGHLPLDDGSVLRACSSCKGQYSDWEIRLRATVSTNEPLVDQGPFGWTQEATSA